MLRCTCRCVWRKCRLSGTESIKHSETIVSSFYLFLSFSLSLHTHIYTYAHTHTEDAPVVCDDFQIAVLMKWVERKKYKKNYRASVIKRYLVQAFYFLKITSGKCLPGMQHRQLYSDRNISTILSNAGNVGSRCWRRRWNSSGLSKTVPQATVRGTMDSLRQIISRFGDTVWPARSPDLTALHYFSLGTL
jgi:hypothetical protein